MNRWPNTLWHDNNNNNENDQSLNNSNSPSMSSNHAQSQPIILNLSQAPNNLHHVQQQFPFSIPIQPPLQVSVSSNPSTTSPIEPDKQPFNQYQYAQAIPYLPPDYSNPSSSQQDLNQPALSATMVVPSSVSLSSTSNSEPNTSSSHQRNFVPIPVPVQQYHSSQPPLPDLNSLPILPNDNQWDQFSSPVTQPPVNSQLSINLTNNTSTTQVIRRRSLNNESKKIAPTLNQPKKPRSRKSSIALPVDKSITASSSSSSSANNPPSNKSVAKRSRMGCLTCRQRKKRCCETRPKCTECNRLGLNCVWPKPGTEHRNKPKDVKDEENTIEHEIYGKIKVLRGIVEYKSK